MSPLVIRQNLSVPDPLSHFSSLWTIHSDSLATSWLTDLRLVAGQQQANMLQVHRAILLPLCPFLALLVEEIDRDEEPLLLLPDFPPELVQSFVKLVYEGCCPLTDVTNVEALLKLLEAVGFDKNRLFNTCADGPTLKVTVEKFVPKEDTKIPTQKFNEPTQKLKTYPANPQDDCNVNEGFDYNLNEEVIVPTKFTVVTEVTAPTEDIEDIATEENNSDLLVKKVRRKSTDEKHFCKFCDFKCRFFRQLVNHSNISHAGLTFKCDQCSYQGTKLMGLRMHMKQVHKGEDLGDFECDICGFKVMNHKKLIGHKKLQHNPVSVKSQEYQPDSTPLKISSIPKDMSEGKRKGKPFNVEGKFSCFRCPFRTMFKPSLLRHVNSFHKVEIEKKS